MKPNQLWLVELVNSTPALWGIAFVALACTILLLRWLPRAPLWRSALFGMAVLFFVAPVHQPCFDPWWADPWPSLWLTSALLVGDFKVVAGFLESVLLLPPAGWALAAGVLCYIGHRARTWRNTSDARPPYI